MLEGLGCQFLFDFCFNGVLPSYAKWKLLRPEQQHICQFQDRWTMNESPKMTISHVSKAREEQQEETKARVMLSLYYLPVYTEPLVWFWLTSS
jgi:hypothetical protein